MNFNKFGMRTSRFFITTLFFIVVILFSFLRRSEIMTGLKNVRMFFLSFFDRTSIFENLNNLRLENEGLKAELERVRKDDAKKTAGFVSAPLYSRYPFGEGGKITVARGKKDNIEPSRPVLAVAGVILGKVTKVSETQSEIKTVLDPDWRSAVFVGKARTKAVLVGGNPPSLEFLPKDAVVMPQDVILNAVSDFPLDLLMGKVGEIESLAQSPWKKAKVDLPYNLDNLERVIIIENFP